MRTTVSEEYELVAKHCPQCEALIMARVEKVSTGEMHYSGDYRCSGCNWKTSTRTQ